MISCGGSAAPRFMIDYDPHDWRSHLCDVRGSMLKEIAARVSLCVISSAGVTLLWHHFPTMRNVGAGRLSPPQRRRQLYGIPDNF